MIILPWLYKLLKLWIKNVSSWWHCLCSSCFEWGWSEYPSATAGLLTWEGSVCSPSLSVASCLQHLYHYVWVVTLRSWVQAPLRPLLAPPLTVSSSPPCFKLTELLKIFLEFSFKLGPRPRRPSALMLVDAQPCVAGPTGELPSYYWSVNFVKNFSKNFVQVGPPPAEARCISTRSGLASARPLKCAVIF